MSFYIKNISAINSDFDKIKPKYATIDSAGMDLVADIEADYVIKAGDVVMIPTGVAIAIDSGFEAQIRPRSGLAAKHSITVLNSPGTIDADYRGEVKVILINHGKKDFVITPYMRIAQMVIASYKKVDFELVDDLTSSERGSGGFGSTGA